METVDCFSVITKYLKLKHLEVLYSSDGGGRGNDSSLLVIGKLGRERCAHQNCCIGENVIFEVSSLSWHNRHSNSSVIKMIYI